MAQVPTAPHRIMFRIDGPLQVACSRGFTTSMTELQMAAWEVTNSYPVGSASAFREKLLKVEFAKAHYNHRPG